MATEVYRPFYKPEGVIEFLGLGTDSFIGTIDETTILKYPKTPGDRTALTILDLEARILTTIGPHKHIVGYKGQREDGLLLERARRGSIAQFLKGYTPACQQRFFLGTSSYRSCCRYSQSRCYSLRCQRQQSPPGRWFDGQTLRLPRMSSPAGWERRQGRSRPREYQVIHASSRSQLLRPEDRYLRSRFNFLPNYAGPRTVSGHGSFQRWRANRGEICIPPVPWDGFSPDELRDP